MDRVSLDMLGPATALVALSGEHELFGAPKLQEQIDTLIADGASIVVDLTDAVFIDSSIVSVLLRSHRFAASRGCDYTVVLGASTGDSIRRMFELTGLAGILPVVERDGALPN
jgi:anti-sigma B factor antagonist